MTLIALSFKPDKKGSKGAHEAHLHSLNGFILEVAS